MSDIQPLRRYRIDTAGRYVTTKPLTVNDVISYAYNKAIIDETMTIEYLDGGKIVEFTKRS